MSARKKLVSVKLPAKRPKPPCTCIDNINGALEANNQAVFCGETMSGKAYPAIVTYNLRTERTVPRPTLFAKFCPWCGVPL